MESSDFRYTSEFDITDDVRNAFNEHGYIIIRGLLDAKETSQLKKTIDETDAITQHGQGVSDDKGRSAGIAIWRHPGHDVTGMISRCEKVAGFAEKLLGGEMYHYHSKLMMKEARTGGKHLWHQDYGYWYKNGFLFPDLLSVFIPVDKSIKQNGCLQILNGSHRCGRIDHVMVAGQTAADLVRVDEIREICPLRYVEMQVGDALFFHCNLLHSSAPNNSALRRYALICCYSKASNNPVYTHEYPQYTKLHKVPNNAISECTNFTDTTDKEFVDLRNDNTVKVG